MDVRPLTAADFGDAAALWEAAGLTRPWNDPNADLARALDGPSSTVLGGFVDSALVATAMAGHDGHRGWVYYLAVAPDLRSRGLGRAVMRAAEEWLAAQGVVKVQLMVRDTNAAALGFYEHLGYAAAEVRVLAKWLREPGR
jgi:ribosomal protein S18 acetylase RimI-like enzyme